MKIRTHDNWGSGAYGAGRGGRVHKGVDMVCQKGDMVRTMRDGVVTKIGYPYKPSDPKKGYFRYVEVAVGNERHRYFYVAPLVAVGERVERHQIIGRAQGIADHYPGMTEHVHVEIKLPDGSFKDPTNLVTAYCFPVKSFIARLVDGIVMLYRRSDGGKVSTGVATAEQAKGRVEAIKQEFPDWGVASVDDVDWTEVEDNEVV